MSPRIFAVLCYALNQGGMQSSPVRSVHRPGSGGECHEPIPCRGYGATWREFRHSQPCFHRTGLAPKPKGVSQFSVVYEPWVGKPQLRIHVIHRHAFQQLQKSLCIHHLNSGAVHQVFGRNTLYGWVAENVFGSSGTGRSRL